MRTRRIISRWNSNFLILKIAKTPHGFLIEKEVDFDIRDDKKVWNYCEIVDIVECAVKDWNFKDWSLYDDEADDLSIQPELCGLQVRGKDYGPSWNSFDDVTTVRTSTAKHQFATLLVFFPSRYEGGTLRVSFHNETKTFDFVETDNTEMRFVVFFSQCTHVIEPVTSGYQICLVYNLLSYYFPFSKTPRLFTNPRVFGLSMLLKRLQIAKEKIIIPLSSLYSNPPRLSQLKEQDAELVRTLLAAKDLLEHDFIELDEASLKILEDYDDAEETEEDPAGPKTFWQHLRNRRRENRRAKDRILMATARMEWQESCTPDEYIGGKALCSTVKDSLLRLRQFANIEDAQAFSVQLDDEGKDVVNHLTMTLSDMNCAETEYALRMDLLVQNVVLPFCAKPYGDHFKNVIEWEEYVEFEDPEMTSIRWYYRTAIVLWPAECTPDEMDRAFLHDYRFSIALFRPDCPPKNYVFIPSNNDDYQL